MSLRQVYFDNAATTPVLPEVITRMSEVLSEQFGNPSSTHAFGRSAKSVIELCRKNIAKRLNAHPSEIIFTSGGTEADNLILRGCVRDLGVRVIITSPIEHHAVLHTVEALAKEYTIEIRYVKLSETGAVDLQDLRNLLLEYPEGKVLVSLMHVNNEVGNILSIKRVGRICKQYGAYFHSDTVQTIGHYPLDLEEIQVDFITASAHKFHGPKGVGFAYIRRGNALHSSLYGGEQEKGLRAGTESVHDIAGMEVAFNQAYEKLDEHTAYLQDLKVYFIAQIKVHFPEAIFNGRCTDMQRSSYCIINVGFPSLKDKNDTLLFLLDMKGVACSKGSACQSGSVQTSHVLKAILPEEQLKYPSLRFSFSTFNTHEEVDFTIKMLKEIEYS